MIVTVVGSSVGMAALLLTVMTLLIGSVNTRIDDLQGTVNARIDDLQGTMNAREFNDTNRPDRRPQRSNDRRRERHARTAQPAHRGAEGGSRSQRRLASRPGTCGGKTKGPPQ